MGNLNCLLTTYSTEYHCKFSKSLFSHPSRILSEGFGVLYTDSFISSVPFEECVNIQTALFCFYA